MKVLEKAIGTIIFILTSLMVIFLFAQIILRSIFDYSLHWADEFTRYGYIWATFLGAALVVKDRGHTRVEYFIRKLPASWFRYINVALNILMMVVLTVLIYNSTPVVSQAMLQTTPGLGIPLGYVTVALPVGGFLMIIYFIYDSVKWLKKEEVS